MIHKAKKFGFKIQIKAPTESAGADIQVKFITIS